MRRNETPPRREAGRGSQATALDRHYEAWLPGVVARLASRALPLGGKGFDALGLGLQSANSRRHRQN